MILAACTTLAACNGRRSPTGIGGGGGTSGSTLASALPGAWVRTVVIQTADDVLSSETLWIFASDGACERRLTTTSVSAGFSDTVTSACTWEATGPAVSITFSGGGTVSFSAAVHGNSLFLDGVEFRRR